MQNRKFSIPKSAVKCYILRATETENYFRTTATRRREDPFI